MNARFNALVAEKCMGWSLNSGECWVSGPTDSVHEHVCSERWNPFDDVNDALMAIERAAVGRGWMVIRTIKPEFRKYVVGISAAPGGKGRDTLALAMSVCALQAVGVTEGEIEEALRAS